MPTSRSRPSSACSSEGSGRIAGVAPSRARPRARLRLLRCRRRSVPLYHRGPATDRHRRAHDLRTRPWIFRREPHTHPAQLGRRALQRHRLRLAEFRRSHDRRRPHLPRRLAQGLARQPRPPVSGLSLLPARRWRVAPHPAPSQLRNRGVIGLAAAVTLAANQPPPAAPRSLWAESPGRLYMARA